MTDEPGPIPESDGRRCSWSTPRAWPYPGGPAKPQANGYRDEGGILLLEFRTSPHCWGLSNVIVPGRLNRCDMYKKKAGSSLGLFYFQSLSLYKPISCRAAPGRYIVGFGISFLDMGAGEQSRGGVDVRLPVSQLAERGGPGSPSEDHVT